MTILRDVARCPGVGNDSYGWPECERCLRRVTGAEPDMVMMDPPAVVAFECEFLIER